MMKISALIFYISVATSISAQTVDPGCRTLNKIKVQGEGGWDYISSDDSLGRLFISHSTIVQVLDVKSGKLIATIPDTKGVHGIALAADLRKGFISNGKDSSVTVFDLVTLKTLANIKVTGKNPDAILYDRFSKKVFVYNGRSSNATVLDAKSNSVIATVPLDGKPEFSATDNNGKIYVNIEDKNKISVINSISNKVEQSWSVSPGEEPSGLAIDTKNQRLFIVCGNKLMIIMDSRSGKIICSIPIGDGVDGVAFDPEKEQAYSANGEGTITIVQGINGNNYKVSGTINTQRGARTITINTKTHHLFLPAAEYETPITPAAGDAKPTRPTIKKDSFVILDVEPK